MAPSTNRVGTEPEARKRVPKACDRCRLKKVKCDGNMPCPRCKMEDAVCHFGSRRKSIERPISAGYVDQIEMQQKILIKALRETWDRYAPSETKKSTGSQPSIHAIVRSLGVLSDTHGHQPIPEDFHFNESLPGSSPALSNTDFSEYDLKTAFPSTSSHENEIARVPPLVNHASASTVTSRAQSEAASIQSAHTSMSPLTGGFPMFKTKMPSPPSMIGRQQKPMYCPLPPRPNATPVKPTRIDSAADGLMDQTEETKYMPWNQTWDNSTVNSTPSFMPSYNMNMTAAANMNMNTTMNMEYMYNNSMPASQGLDDNWNAFIDEHPEYASLDPVVWSHFLCARQ